MESHKKPNENPIPHYFDFQVIPVCSSSVPKQSLYLFLKANIRNFELKEFVNLDTYNKNMMIRTVSVVLPTPLFKAKVPANNHNAMIFRLPPIKPWQIIGFKTFREFSPPPGDLFATKENNTPIYPFFSAPETATIDQIKNALKQIQQQRHSWWWDSTGNFNSEITAQLSKAQNVEEAKLILVDNYCLSPN